MRRAANLFTACVILVAACLGAVPAFIGAAGAASAPSDPGAGQALEIAPPVVYLSANRGQTIKTNIQLRDISSSNLIVTGEANDFVAEGESGTPKILLNNNDDNDPYSLRTWITPPSSMLLVPKEIKTMPITITVPANASPGGHYGVIRFTGTPPSLSGTGVSLSASIGTLVLLTVNGKINENLSIKEFSVNHKGKTGNFFEGGPLDFVVRLNNQGNIHEQPVGLITVSDMFGKKMATLRVNNPPHNVLPASIRKFQATMDKTVIGNKRLFGHYTATLKMTYGKDKKPVNATLSFWIIPYKLILIAIAVLIAAFFILRFSIRRYNDYIIGKSGGRHRRR